MNVSMSVFALLGIVVAIFLLKRHHKKIGIIVLIFFALMFFASFSSSSKTKDDTSSTTSTVAETKSDITPTPEQKKVTDVPTVVDSDTPSLTATLTPTNTLALTDTPVPTDTPATEESIPTEEINVEATESVNSDSEDNTYDKFILSWNVEGEYGKKMILNKDTKMAMTYIAFQIPAGVYTVTNKADRGAAQVTVYSGIVKNGQVEEFSSDNCAFPIVVMAGKDSKELEIKEGQFIKLSDNSTNIEFSINK